jgi:1-deoxyxylulose-5-phosphate synthase
MRTVRLGATGLEVSAVCLGCMSFGQSDRGPHSWTLDEPTSRELIREALDAGITFFDTANYYGLGTSEEFVGRALGELTRRDDVVIATKVFMPMRPGPNGGGLSRKVILSEIDHSLRRLGTDYVDLYQIHRWDPDTPIEETLEALNDIVRAGKARYLGASSMQSWQFSKALYLADAHGWTRFASMQNHYNLLYREEEREMLPLCADQGIGVVPWSPLARGRLTRPWDEATRRSQADKALTSLYDDDARAIVTRVSEVASRRGLSNAQVALAWVMRNPVVTAPIVGVTKSTHLAQAVAAVDIELSDDEVAFIEEPYRPRPVLGQGSPRPAETGGTRSPG